MLRAGMRGVHARRVCRTARAKYLCHGGGRWLVVFVVCLWWRREGDGDEAGRSSL